MDDIYTDFFGIFKMTATTTLLSFNPELHSRAAEILEFSEDKLRTEILPTLVIPTKEAYEDVLLSITLFLTNMTISTYEQKGGQRHFTIRQKPTMHKIPDRKKFVKENKQSRKFHRNKHFIWLQKQYNIRNRNIEKQEIEKKLKEVYFEIMLEGKKGIEFPRQLNSSNDFIKLFFFFFCHITPIFSLPTNIHTPAESMRIENYSEPRESVSIVSEQDGSVSSLVSLPSEALSLPSNTSLSTYVALTNPKMAALEVGSILMSATRSSQLKSKNTCPVGPAISFGGTNFVRGDIDTLRLFHTLSGYNESMPEFGCQIISRNDRLQFDRRLMLGDRGSVSRGIFSKYSSREAVGSCHFHPEEWNRLQSPPSEADYGISLGNAMLASVAYEFVFTQTGIYIIRPNDDILTFTESWLSGNKLTAVEASQYLKQHRTIRDTYDMRYVDDTTSLFSNTLQDHMKCGNSTSSELTYAQNLFTVSVTNRDSSVSNIQVGFHVYFISNQDLRLGNMIALPWAKRFKKLNLAFEIVTGIPREEALPNNGISGNDLVESLIQLYQMNTTSRQVQMLRDSSKIDDTSFIGIWNRIKTDPFLSRKMAELIYADRHSPIQRQRLARRDPKYLMNVEKRAEKLRGGHNSILNKPGIISKYILGSRAKETLFMDLPYPYNLLKSFI
jgi:hypothetical protein